MTPLHVAARGLLVDPEYRYVEYDGEMLMLSEGEFQLLELLWLRRGSVVTKEMFLDHLYGDGDGPTGTKIIEVRVCKIRRRLRDIGAPDPIETIWGRGYMLRLDR